MNLKTPCLVLLPSIAPDPSSFLFSFFFFLLLFFLFRFCRFTSIQQTFQSSCKMQCAGCSRNGGLSHFISLAVAACVFRPSSGRSAPVLKKSGNLFRLRSDLPGAVTSPWSGFFVARLPETPFLFNFFLFRFFLYLSLALGRQRFTTSTPCCRHKPLGGS